MSEQIPEQPTQAPDGGGQPDAQQSSPTPDTPDAGANPQAGTTPDGEPFAVFPTSESFMRRVGEETRRELRRHAEQAGYASWEAMVAAVQNGQSGEEPEPGTEPDPEPPADPEPDTEPEPQALDEAARLRLALRVGTEKNLPPALIARLQGNTAEEMEADADTLLGIVRQHNRPGGPGIPPAPGSEPQTTTFTRAQLRDAAFVREHAAEIQAAARAGRIVDG